MSRSKWAHLANNPRPQPAANLTKKGGLSVGKWSQTAPSHGGGWPSSDSCFWPWVSLGVGHLDDLEHSWKECCFSGHSEWPKKPVWSKPRCCFYNYCSIDPLLPKEDSEGHIFIPNFYLLIPYVFTSSFPAFRGNVQLLGDRIPSCRNIWRCINRNPVVGWRITKNSNTRICVSNFPTKKNSWMLFWSRLMGALRKAKPSESTNYYSDLDSKWVSSSLKKNAGD